MPKDGKTLRELLGGDAKKTDTTKSYNTGIPKNKVKEGDVVFVDVPLEPSNNEDFKRYMKGERIVIAGILYDSYFSTIEQAKRENAWLWNDYYKLVVIDNVLYRQRIISFEESLNRKWWDVTH